MTSLMIPIGTYGGFLFGSGNVKGGLVVITGQTIIAVLQGNLWYKSMELMEKKHRK